MANLSAPIVGMHFRPPAKVVLEHLPSGCPLNLQPEPENPYDERAIKVLVPAEHLPQEEEFKQLLELNWGVDLEEFYSQPLFLGYIARTEVEPFHFEAYPAGHLGFSPEGKPFFRGDL